MFVQPIFTPVRMGDLKLPNRIVMAPLTRMRAGPIDHVPTALQAEYYAQRASAGVIVAEAPGPISPILIWSSGSRPVPRSRRSTGQPSTTRAGAAIPTTRPSVIQWPDPAKIPDLAKIKETEMNKTTPEWNKALVLEAFDTLFNKRDYSAAERFWSDRYDQLVLVAQRRRKRAGQVEQPLAAWRDVDTVLNVVVAFGHGGRPA